MAKTKQPDFSEEVIAKALSFLNLFQNPEELTQKIQDDPEYGSASPERSIGIGKTVAYRILTKRSELPNEQFSNLKDLSNIRGLGKDKLHDLLYTFARKAPEEIIFTESDRPEVREMQELIIKIKDQLKEERSQGKPDRNELEVAIDQLKTETQGLEDLARRAKDLATRRKEEIDEWKAWFNRLTAEEQEDGFAKLKSEIDWRAHELNTLTPEIQDLLIRIEEQEGKIQMANQKLIALDQGVFEMPLMKDPRLAHLMDRLEKIESTIL